MTTTTTTFNNWKLRRQLMAWAEQSMSQRYLALVLIDNIDWNHGYKKFSSKSHYENWLKRLAEVNGIEWELLKTTVDLMVKEGFATFSKATGEIQLITKDDWADESNEDE